MRMREIIHRDGARLRLCLSSGEASSAPLIRLGDPGALLGSPILLDLYGADLLAGFLMSARLSAPGELSDECCQGDFPLRMGLCAPAGEPQVELHQADQRLILPKGLWDRLYTELQLALAHGRHWHEARPAFGPVPLDARRLLH